MRAVDVIMRKRSGAELDRAELEFLIGGYVAGNIPEYQVAAWAMAVFFRGMTPAETGALTEVMLRSGSTIDLSALSGPFVDKHSTGGVGDKTSLVIAPIVAALGVKVPMMSGRALGHTGGTLDKLEAVPGYSARLDVDRFRAILAADGFAMTGQTKEIVPADRLLYALRDVTATVESIPLITASILSKKVAEGSEGLVFDVKSGSGAFMKTRADAEALAASLVATGRAMGKRVIALLTDMDEPLGLKVGNFLEMEEGYDCLDGRGPADLMEVNLELAARMLVLGGKAIDAAHGRTLCLEALASGRPRELFLKNIASQGGDPAEFLRLKDAWRAPFSATVRAERSGYLRRVDAGRIGRAGVLLGVGRNRTEDAVLPDVGFVFAAQRGAALASGDPIVTVYARSDEALAAVLSETRAALEIGDEPPAARHLILKEIA